MKYENQIFNLSAEAYTKAQEPNAKNKEILRAQSRLLEILLKKFQEELKSKKENNQGILRVKFQKPFNQDSELGYQEIAELVESGNFDFFASEYCFYLGNVEHHCDETHTAYFEVIWDFKTYFEQLSMQQIDIPTQSIKLKVKVAKAKMDFSRLPINHQISILKSFAKNVANAKKSSEHETAIKTCATDGHLFGEWEEIEYQTRGVYWDAGLKENIWVNRKKWRKICQRCGAEEVVYEEPQELIDKRKEKLKQEEIKNLERKLKELKNN